MACASTPLPTHTHYTTPGTHRQDRQTDARCCLGLHGLPDLPLCPALPCPIASLTRAQALLFSQILVSCARAVVCSVHGAVRLHDSTLSCPAHICSLCVYDVSTPSISGIVLPNESPSVRPSTLLTQRQETCACVVVCAS